LAFAAVEGTGLPTRGLRVDVIALGSKGEILIVECKSSPRRFYGATANGDGYLEWAGQVFLGSVDADFRHLTFLPDDTGLFIATATVQAWAHVP